MDALPKLVDSEVAGDSACASLTLRPLPGSRAELCHLLGHCVSGLIGN